MIRRSVVLPQPFGPSRHTTSPFSTRSDTASNTGIAYRFVTSCTSNPPGSLMRASTYRNGRTRRSLRSPRAERASAPALESACQGVEHELVGHQHDRDPDESPDEDHLRRQDLPAVVHDVSDAPSHTEDLG